MWKVLTFDTVVASGKKETDIIKELEEVHTLTLNFTKFKIKECSSHFENVKRQHKGGRRSVSNKWMAYRTILYIPFLAATVLLVIFSVCLGAKDDEKTGAESSSSLSNFVVSTIQSTFRVRLIHCIF